MARIKDTIIEKQDTGVDNYGSKTKDLKDWIKSYERIIAQERRDELGISRNHFTDNQISPNPLE